MYTKLAKIYPLQKKTEQKLYLHQQWKVVLQSKKYTYIFFFFFFVLLYKMKSHYFHKAL